MMLRRARIIRLDGHEREIVCTALEWAATAYETDSVTQAAVGAAALLRVAARLRRVVRRIDPHFYE